ncbi:MAG: hypothetical protein ACI4F3_13240, partial [Enterocloster sp.]
MKRCLNCMEEYSDRQNSCPCCGYVDGQQGQEDCLVPGTIIQRRYIVGCCKSQDDSEIVYIGWDELFKRKVLIRELYIQPHCRRFMNGEVEVSEEDQAGFEQEIREFIEVGRQLIRLYKEKDILTVYSTFAENGTAYIICQYLPEAARVNTGGVRMEISGAQTLFIDLLTALDKCHSAKLYFGGVRPEQIYCLNDGVILGGQRRPMESTGMSQRKDIRSVTELFCTLALGGYYQPGKKGLSRELGKLGTEMSQQQIEMLRYILDDQQKNQLNVSARELKEAFSDTGQHHTTVRLGGDSWRGQRKESGFFDRLSKEKLILIIGIVLILAIGTGAAVGLLLKGKMTKQGDGTATASEAELPQESSEEAKKESGAEEEKIREAAPADQIQDEEEKKAE